MARPVRVAGWLTALLLALVCVVLPLGSAPKTALAYETVSGAGSTWVQIALDQWRADIAHHEAAVLEQAHAIAMQSVPPRVASSGDRGR